MKKYTNQELANINALSKFYNIPKSISTLLVNRGIDTEVLIAKYFKKEYNLSSPLQFPTIKKAIKRINKAIISDEKIVIFGDYDVDGMIATSMIFLYLTRIKANVDYFIPDREKDGYGFNESSVKRLVEEYNPDLIISVDTGITAKKEIEDLKKMNIDVIVTDHHDVQIDKIPNATAVINPKFIKDDIHHLQCLSGGGVAFYFLRAINTALFAEGKRQNMVDFLVMAMITSISDMMQLKGDNRIIVEYGISYLYDTNILGLNLLLDNINFFEYPTASDVGQKLSPIINSAGRIGDPNTVISLFTDETLNVYDKVNQLVNLNTERKDVTKTIYNKIKKELGEEFAEDVIIIDDSSLNIGLIGLVATRLCYDYEKPVVVIGGFGDDNKRKVSMRSFGALQLNPLFEEIKQILEGGGHNYAIGGSISEENIDSLKKEIQKFFKNKKNSKRNEVEFEMSVEDIDDSFIRLVHSMEPFGNGNPKPIIRINNITSYTEAKLLKKEHFKIELNKNISTICFFPTKKNMEKYQHIIKENHKFFVEGEIQSNGERISMIISNIGEM